MLNIIPRNHPKENHWSRESFHLIWLIIFQWCLSNVSIRYHIKAKSFGPFFVRTRRRRLGFLGKWWIKYLINFNNDRKICLKIKYNLNINQDRKEHKFFDQIRIRNNLLWFFKDLYRYFNKVFNFVFPTKDKFNMIRFITQFIWTLFQVIFNYFVLNNIFWQ